jgi:hypothetical protein
VAVGSQQEMSEFVGYGAAQNERGFEFGVVVVGAA